MSPAYIKLLTLLSPIRIPPWVNPCKSYRTIVSANILKREGDRMQLWRTPLLMWNNFVTTNSGIRSLIFIHVYIIRNKSAKCGGNPIFNILSHNFGWPTESKALWKSTNHMNSGWLITELSSFFHQYSDVDELISITSAWHKASFVPQLRPCSSSSVFVPKMTFSKTLLACEMSATLRCQYISFLQDWHKRRIHPIFWPRSSLPCSTANVIDQSNCWITR